MLRRLALGSGLLPVAAFAQPAVGGGGAEMTSVSAAVVSGACIFGGALLGMVLGKVVPPEHLSSDSRDAIKIGAGMISLMAALVLGLLVSSAKNNFDATNAAITQGSARVILLDRVLARYGAESEDVRRDLRSGVETNIAMLWPDERSADSGLVALEHSTAMERVLEKIRGLTPRSDAQRALQLQAQQLGNDILLSRWVQIEQARTTLPAAFLRILLFWLTMLYLTFGLIAPRNGTVTAVLFFGALSLATAVFLILEMNDPTRGAIRISSGPMRNALEHVGQ